jgi:hypothetical protein
VKQKEGALKRSILAPVTVLAAVLAAVLTPLLAAAELSPLSIGPRVG